MKKAIKVFIFCLFVWSLLLPTVTFAAQKTIVLSLKISGQPQEFVIDQQLLDKVNKIIKEKNFNLTIAPVVVEETTINDVDVISTVNGDQQVNLVLSVF